MTDSQPEGRDLRAEPSAAQEWLDDQPHCATPREHMYPCGCDDVASFDRLLAQAREAGAFEMLDRLRNSLKFWPEDGCDSVIAAEVQRIESLAREAGRKTSMEDVTSSIQEQLEFSYERGREAGRREGLRAALKLPRPWIDGGVSWPEWDALMAEIERSR